MPYKDPEDRRAQHRRWLEANKEAAYKATREWQQSEHGRQKRAEWRIRRLAEMNADPTHRTHGTLSGYTIGCRCDTCRAAKPNRRNGLERTPRPDQHGTVRQYATRGCRCDECRAANAASVRKYRARKKERADANG
jgi:hypothetical protein